MINKVLFVDDEKNVLNSYRRLIRGQKFHGKFCYKPEDALKLIENERFSVIVTDMRMTGIDGAELLRRSLVFDTKPIKIVVTGFEDIDAAQRAINKGNVYRYINKPFDGQDLLKILNEAIDYYNEKLKQQERLLVLGQFVSKVVHDLKNPLSGIRGSAEVLLDFFEYSNTAEEFCRLIIDQTDEMTAMAQELLDYASRPGDVRYSQITHIELGELMHNWIRIWQTSLEDNKVILTIDTAEPCFIDAVPVHMTRAFNNLLRNSLDIPETTRVLIDIKQAEDKTAIIRFLDNGGGIPDNIMNKVFDSFFTYGKVHGTGLGLSNSKDIVEHLKGSISVSNQKWAEGYGAEFTIKLPLNN